MATATSDFLLEIGSEEMPSAPLEKAIKELAQLAQKRLAETGLAHGAIEVLSTPRRLTLYVHDMATTTEELREEAKGPAAAIAFDADGNPTKAALGFCRGKGVDPSALTVREVDGKDYVFVETFTPAKSARELLEPLAAELIGAVSWPRSMRWGYESARYVRPIRWILCLLGEDVLTVRYANVVSGATTRGHRVLGPGEHTVARPEDYVRVLKEHGVLLQEERRSRIREQLAAYSERTGLTVETPAGTFNEVVNLCEWPTVMVGRFDEEFLAVPHEIICESMLKNQRYFPVYDASHNLTCNFVVVSNGDPACEATIIDGNERVVRARLDDAKFFYEEDLKTPLDELGTRLESVVFQEQLGTMAQKVERMEAVAPAVAAAAGVSEEEVAATQRAAALAKADLVSQAVVEFTSQQGTMGGYYARQGGEGEAVATAIAQQYRPRFAGDVLPETTVAKALSIADKIDTICGMFAIGEPPTGSSDPFAQRRGAIGIINMLLALPAVSLDRLIQASLESYQAQGLEFDLAATKAKVHDFFLGRLETIAKDDGSAPDSIEAVASVGVIHPRDFMARVAALDEARRTQPELFEDLATAYARAAHLSDPSLGTSVDLALLSAPEKALYEACSSAQSEVSVALEAHDYAAALAALASLREPIDAFFDDVMVMDEDAALRKNRLKLLNRFVEVFTGVANFSLLSRA